MHRGLVAGLLLLVALVATGIVVAAGSSEPERPPWVGSDGRLLPERAPAFVEVAGPDGEPVVCSNGKRLKVRGAQLFGPPTATPSELRRQPPADGGEDLVWRCGDGPSPDLNARLVPQSRDPLRRDE